MQCIQQLPTSGARAAEVFVHEGTRYLAVPQLATDIAGQPAQMTLGDSNTEAIVYRWERAPGAEGRFVEHTRLPVPGGEDAKYFEIGARAFLATASLRSGAGPYTMRRDSTIFEVSGGRFTPFQQVPAMAAKQWLPFSIGGRHFLALAQGVVAHGGPAAGAQPGAEPAARSCIFEWDGQRFAEFQSIDSAWGYNWAFFEVGGQQLLAYADHAAPSRLLRWSGERFEDFQVLDGGSGRAFCFFTHAGESWLAFANLMHDTVLLRWSGGRFVPHQVLCERGGREFEWIVTAQGPRLVLVRFLQGSREAPVTALHSIIFRFDDSTPPRLVVSREFPTLGGTNASAFEDGGALYLVVSHSLSAGVRFATPSMVYRLAESPLPATSASR